MKAFLTFQLGDSPVGTLHLDLNEKIVPRTVQNFTTFLTRRHDEAYLNSRVHRLIKGFMLQAGDFTKGDGTGGYSIFGNTFSDENFLLQHDRPGTLSMANAGKDTNGSQFFCTFRATPHLNGKHVVFGYVDLEKSGTVLKALEQIRTGGDDRPLRPLKIVDCGVVSEESTEKPAAEEAIMANNKDSDEIDLDEVEDEEEQERVEEEEDDDDDGKPLSKAEALKRRLRKLKKKMNQAKILNRQAVKEEGELASEHGTSKERKRQAFVTKEAKKAEWERQNAKALETASKAGVDGKYLTEQAADSVYKARVTADKRELRQYSMKDEHNPEGQHRSYQRDLKTLPRNAALSSTTDSYNPLQDSADPERERLGAQRLAAEMHRRIKKKQKNQLKRKDRDDDGDVSYINQRNKNFNEKINRNYDKHTREIRENLERGTAL